MGSLRDIDIRLLENLLMLVTERSVTRAAERSGVSQSRMSNVLAKLRLLFADPLLIRSKGGMAPTERALQIADSVRTGLTHIEAAFAEQRPFDPTGPEQVHFVLAMSDYVSTLIAPDLMRRLTRARANVRISIKMTDPARVRDWLDAGECDFAFGFFMHLGEALRSSVLRHDSATCLARAGHPALDRALTVEDFAAASHAVMGGAPTPISTLEQMVDAACAELGFTRHVAIRAPSLVLLADIVAQTDLLAVVPKSLGDHFERRATVRQVALPLLLSSMDVTMVWHERAHRQPAHVWLRRQIRQTIKEIDVLEPDPKILTRPRHTDIV